MEWHVLDWSGSELGQVESSCEHGNKHSGSIKMLGIYRVAAQLVLCSIQLVISLGRITTSTDQCKTTNQNQSSDTKHQPFVNGKRMASFGMLHRFLQEPHRVSDPRRRHSS
jgi:hypothetical protein